MPGCRVPTPNALGNGLPNLNLGQSAVSSKQFPQCEMANQTRECLLSFSFLTLFVSPNARHPRLPRKRTDPFTARLRPERGAEESGAFLVVRCERLGT